MKEKLNIAGFVLISVLIFCKPLLSDEFQPGDHQLLIMPTAYTMRQGQAYFEDYELLLLSYSTAPFPRTHISVFSMFPITSDFLEILTVGSKHKYLHTKIFDSALWINYTFKNELLNIGNVLSIKAGKRNSLHLGLAFLTTDDLNSEWVDIIMAGYRGDISSKTSFMCEYMNSTNLIENSDFRGFICVGFRFRSSNIAWEVGGLRPLENTGDILLLPILKGTYLFEIK